MLARPNRPLIPTPVDVRVYSPERPSGTVFEGWGVTIGNRFS